MQLMKTVTPMNVQLELIWNMGEFGKIVNEARCSVLDTLQRFSFSLEFCIF